MTQLLPADFGYVFLGLFATVLSMFYLTVLVVKARKKYGIKYPTLYADKSFIDEKGLCKTQADLDKYNCAQRAHQNTVEGMATMQLLGVVNGILFPRFSGACLFIYALGRVLYGRGYTTSGPTGRMLGGLLSHVADMPMFFCTAYSGAVLLGYV